MRNRFLLSIICLLCFLASLSVASKHAQAHPAGAQNGVQESFPYPVIPDSLQSGAARLGYMLAHFWQDYCFSDTTIINKKVGEQGLVDFINLMQYADSAQCADAACTFADSIGKDSIREAFFIELTDHYLGHPQSPLRNDGVYAHLLRALPPTPQRLFLLQQVERHLPGMAATDFAYDDGQGRQQRLYDISAPFTLLVFFDPHCERCQELLPQIKEQTAAAVHSGRLALVLVDTERNTQAAQLYYLPQMPSLYLLDAQKKVVVKDGSLENISKLLD